MDLTPILQGGRLIQVVGESGSGLSLVARHLHERVPGAAVQRQDALSHVTFLRATVVEEACVGLEQRGVPREEMRRRAGRILRLIGLDALAERDPVTLSGGELRRLAFACVAVLEPDTLVLDEPFAGLDVDSAAALSGYLGTVRGRVVVLGTSYRRELGGQCLSLVDATLTPTSPPTPTRPALPERVAPSGRVLELGMVGARRGGSTRRLWRRGRGPSFVLQPVNLKAACGGVLWLQGPNGSGKTSLLRALAGLDSAGAAPGAEASLALQRAADQVAESTVRDFVGPGGLALAPRADPEAHPLDLSARDLRLAQLAQVFGQRRPLVLLDEPDVGLDGPGREAAHRLIAAGLRRGAAVVLTTHDPGFAGEVGRYADVEKLRLGGG